MALKFFLKKLDEVDEALRKLYVEDKESGGFMLDTDNAELKVLRDDFRANNRSLSKEKETLAAALKQFEGIDPVRAKEAQDLLAKIEEQEDAALLKAGKWDVVLNKKTEKLRGDYEGKLTAAQKKLLDMESASKSTYSELQGMLLERTLMKTVDDVGSLKPGARDFVLRAAQDLWRMDEQRNFNAVDPRSGEKVMGKKAEPITMKEWLEELRDKNTFLFEDAKGSGGKGPRPGAGQPTGKRRLVNPTPLDFEAHAEAIAKGEVVVVRE